MRIILAVALTVKQTQTHTCISDRLLYKLQPSRGSPKAILSAIAPTSLSHSLSRPVTLTRRHTFSLSFPHTRCLTFSQHREAYLFWQAPPGMLSPPMPPTRGTSGTPYRSLTLTLTSPWHAPCTGEGCDAVVRSPGMLSPPINTWLVGSPDP